MLRQLLLAITIGTCALTGPAAAHDNDFERDHPGQTWLDMPAPELSQGHPAIRPWQDFANVTTAFDQRTAAPTGHGAVAVPTNRTPAQLPKTMTAQYGHHPGVILSVNELPPTRLSSFVADSGYDENIYGDEGTLGPPPIHGFEYNNTIAAGLCNCGNGEGLTTGHHPDADMTHGPDWYAEGNVDYSPELR